MVVTSSAPRKKSFRWIADHAAGMSAYVNDVSGAIALISVQGPRSRDLLSPVVDNPSALLALRFFRFGANRINDTELIVSRSGYTGELGYELYVPAEEAASLWEFLERRGKEFGLLPYGVGAMQSLRIEKALPLAGPDIDGEQNPFELGLHKWIDFSKREFVGREALLAIQERGLRRRWVGLILGSTAPANPGDAVYTVADVAADRPVTPMDIDANEEFDAERSGWTQIGRITSSARGHSVGKMLALAYLDVSHTWSGARVMVATGGGRPLPATVANTPFFDPAGLRLRGTAEYAPADQGGDTPGGASTGDPRGAKGRKGRAER
jgi:aminomethyltransferase